MREPSSPLDCSLACLRCPRRSQVQSSRVRHAVPFTHTRHSFPLFLSSFTRVTKNQSTWPSCAARLSGVSLHASMPPRMQVPCMHVACKARDGAPQHLLQAQHTYSAVLTHSPSALLLPLFSLDSPDERKMRRKLDGTRRICVSCDLEWQAGRTRTMQLLTCLQHDCTCLCLSMYRCANVRVEQSSESNEDTAAGSQSSTQLRCWSGGHFCPDGLEPRKDLIC